MNEQPNLQPEPAGAGATAPCVDGTGKAWRAVLLLLPVPLLAPGGHAVILSLFLLPLLLLAVLLGAAAAMQLVPRDRRGPASWLGRGVLPLAVLGAGWLGSQVAGECVQLALATSRASDWSTGTAAGRPLHPDLRGMLGAGLRYWWAALGVAGLGGAGLALARVRLRGPQAVWLGLLGAMLPLAALATWLADRSGFMAWTA